MNFTLQVNSCFVIMALRTLGSATWINWVQPGLIIKKKGLDCERKKIRKTRGCTRPKLTLGEWLVKAPSCPDYQIWVFGVRTEQLTQSVGILTDLDETKLSTVFLQNYFKSYI